MLEWDTTDAARVLIGTRSFPSRGRVTIYPGASLPVTLAAVSALGSASDVRRVFLTPAFEAELPRIARPADPWRAYLKLRAAIQARTAKAFRRMMLGLRVPHRGLRVPEPVRRIGPHRAQLAAPVKRGKVLPGPLDFLPMAHSRAAMRQREDIEWQSMQTGR